MALYPQSRNTVRRGDKRYNLLKLCVEVVGDPVMLTNEWSSKGYVIPNYEGEETEGALLYPILSVEGRQGRVPVVAKVIQSNPDLVMAIQSFGPEGARILAPVMGAEPLSLSVTPAYRTVDWSLSGFMLAEYRGTLKKGQRFEAHVQTETTTNAVTVNCYIIRADPVRQVLAVRFEGITNEAFSFLERAMITNSRLEQMR